MNLGSSDTDEATGLTLAPDGSFFVVGDVDENQGLDDAGLFSLDSGGVLNAGFGSGGSIVADLGGADILRAVTLQPDGAIVAAGTQCGGLATGCDGIVVRRLADGSLDPGFGTAGVARFDAGSNDQFDSVAVQADGKIVAGGVSYNASTGYYDFAVARFDATGVLDASFGASGVALTQFGTNARGRGLKLTSGGKIVLAGQVAFDSGHDDVGLARYNADGTPDNTFGSGGTVVTDLGGVEQGRGLAVQSDGKLVVAGIHYSTADFIAKTAVLRYATDGSLDPTFGNGGVAYGLDHSAAYSVAVQPDGKVVAGGVYDPSGFGLNRFGVTRFNGDGTLNTGYGSGGVAQAAVSGSSDQGLAVVVQSDGKVVLAGRGLQDMTVIRFLAADLLASETLPAGGGTVTTAANPTSDDPIAVALTTADGGDVSITASPTADVAPSGYTLLGSQFDISAPTATLGGQPLTLTFRLDASLFPPGDQDALSSIAMLRNGVPLRACSSGPLDATNADDACSTATLDGNVGVISVQSWHASKWHAARLDRQPYPFSGFFAPVDNRDSSGNLILNKVQPGSAVPVKFSLGGDRGLSIFAVGSPGSVKIACDPTAPVDPLEQTVPAAASSLTYDPVSQRYTYVWKTSKSFDGCRQFRMTLVDGTTRVADFKFGR